MKKRESKKRAYVEFQTPNGIISLPLTGCNLNANDGLGSATRLIGITYKTLYACDGCGAFVCYEDETHCIDCCN